MEKHNFERRESIEKVENAAIVYRGEIFSGISHGHAFGKLLDQYPNIKDEEIEGIEETDGFVTTKGRFVDRKEALSLARKNGQLRPEKNNREKEFLFTEDMRG